MFFKSNKTYQMSNTRKPNLKNLWFFRISLNWNHSFVFWKSLKRQLKVFLVTFAQFYTNLVSLNSFSIDREKTKAIIFRIWLFFFFIFKFYHSIKTFKAFFFTFSFNEKWLLEIFKGIYFIMGHSFKTFFFFSLTFSLFFSYLLVFTGYFVCFFYILFTLEKPKITRQNFERKSVSKKRIVLSFSNILLIFWKLLDPFRVIYYKSNEYLFYI